MGRRRKPSLRFSIGIALVGVVVLTAAVLIVNSFLSARENAEAAMSALTRLAGQQTEARIRAYLEPTASLATDVARRIQRGDLTLERPGALEREFFALMRARSGTAVVAYANEAGEWIMVKRMPDGSLDTKTIRIQNGVRTVTWHEREPGQGLFEQKTRTDPDDTYDPRVRQWYTAAMRAGETVWSDVYVFWTDKRPGVSAATPVAGEDGRVLGVAVVDLNLSEIAAFVADIHLGEDGAAVIIDERGRLISGPNPDELVVKTADGATFEARPAVESGDPRIAALARSPEFEAAMAEGLDDPVQLRVETSAGPLVAGLRAVELAGGHRWIVATLLPEEAFVGPLRRTNTENVWTSIVVVLIALLLGSVITRRVSRSMTVLQSETRAIQQLTFEESRAESPFSEVEDVLRAFERMKVGLRSFRKYVPVKLVRELLGRQVEPVLGGEFMEVTIYFSDMKGFAGISEAMHPMEMAERLGHYLGALTEQIDGHSGTAVQYVGDEIMALWGAPQPVEHHARRACDGALACAQRVHTLWDEGDDTPIFHTRFGLHTARVAVGHFGSEYRLYYGAIGDGINLASRLEGLNKHYDTEILVSETTRALLGDAYQVRLVDRVIVKGRQTPIAIYELLGRTGEVDPQQLARARAYEAALNAYFARDFEAAKRQFATDPRDGPSKLMQARCARLAADPPPSDWDGAHAMTEK